MLKKIKWLFDEGKLTIMRKPIDFTLIVFGILYSIIAYYVWFHL
jgi:hypothetical protein